MARSSTHQTPTIHANPKPSAKQMMAEASRLSGLVDESVNNSSLIAENIDFKSSVSSKMHFTQNFFKFLSEAPDYELACTSLQDSVDSFKSSVTNYRANDNFLSSISNSNSGKMNNISQVYTNNGIVNNAKSVYDAMVKVIASQTNDSTLRLYNNNEYHLNAAAPSPITAASLNESRSSPSAQKPVTPSPM